MSLPKRLIVEYDDGSQREVSFSKLNNKARHEIATLGLCPAPGGVGSSKRYALLRWKDGWQEVIGIDKDKVDLLRCYVIQRIEDRGRLSFDVGGDYPELFIIKRMPRGLSSLLIVGDDGVKSYPLDSEVERWEGIFEAGGKKEYVKYDRTDAAYPQKVLRSPGLKGILDSVKKKLEEKGLKAQELLKSNQDKRIEVYKEIAKEAGVQGYQKEEDVYGFIELVVRMLAAL